MFILYQVGIFLEPATGHLRLFLLYLVSVLGGAAGALLLDPFALTGGASGGVFGVAAAATLLLHAPGRAVLARPTWGPLIVINFALGFFIGGVSIGGHIGGIVAGLLATEAMLQGRARGTTLARARRASRSSASRRSVLRCGPRTGEPRSVASTSSTSPVSSSSTRR